MVSIFFIILFGLFVNGIFAQDLVHTVVRGDTIFSLSRRYEVSQDELLRHNRLSDASKLQVGMKLNIPSKQNTQVNALTNTEYIVKANDTLFSIARTHGITVQALADLNNISRDYKVKTGEKLRISNVVPVLPRQVQPPSTTRRPVDPSIRWPVPAKEVLYLASNMGVLITGEESASIKSLSKGTVVHASPWRGYGNVTIVEGGNGYKYIYGSCKALSVKKGDVIEAGAELGKLGIFPASGKPDLVFIVLKNDSPVDPAKAPRF